MTRINLLGAAVDRALAASAETIRERHRKSAAEWYSRNKDKVRRLNTQPHVRVRVIERRRKWRSRSKEKIMFMAAKGRAKKYGLEFNIDESDIVIPEYCPVLGFKLRVDSDGDRRPKQFSPSLDRINPAKGYVKGNVRVISLKANTIKSDASVEELRAVLRYVESTFEDL